MPSLIKTIPSRLIYGKHCHLPVELELDEIRLEAYESTLLYKQKTKKWRDQRIDRREFKVADQEMVYNFRLNVFAGKLKSKWSGPSTVTKVFPHGPIEVQRLNNTFKVSGNGAKHYRVGEPLETLEVLNNEPSLLG